MRDCRTARARIYWKSLVGLDLTDPGFDQALPYDPTVAGRIEVDDIGTGVVRHEGGPR
ncbi:hypothetical protein ACIRP7_40220 [Streptomyces sp. NPDC102270]|uniref:hypothetical protein n=1 Tax=Streptomyces sp. NPDC102270 TaxID=3366150 RepID=UPI00382646D8